MADNSNVTATLHTEAGDIKLEFFNDKAPRHVENFISLAEKGFYDGTIFHRVIPGFMIQGGCPDGTGMGNPGYSVDQEFNDTKHVRGTLSMARAQDPNSAGSQFFICHGEASFLNGQYTAFGQMQEGEEALDTIAQAPTKSGGEGSSPVEPVKITKITVTRG
jgi:peptidyl-prolyl cis-trans isomerase B (cyclophilin B)